VIINLPSVPHTGHHFMMYRVFTMFKPKPVNDDPHFDDGDSVADHFHDFNMAAWTRVLPRYRCFISLRHPCRVLASHEGRNTVLANRMRFVQQWEQMMLMHEQGYYNDPFYFHLDGFGGLREAEAEYMLGQVGESHAVDWSVNEESGSKANTHEMEITKHWLDKVPAKFVQFYEQTIEWSCDKIIESGLGESLVGYAAGARV